VYVPFYLKRRAKTNWSKKHEDEERGRPRVKAMDSCFRWLIAQTQDMQIKLANKRRAAWHQYQYQEAKRKRKQNWKIQAEPWKCQLRNLAFFLRHFILCYSFFLTKGYTALKTNEALMDFESSQGEG